MSKKIIFTNGLIDLAQPRLGSKVIFKTDDFFASAKRIIEPTAPVFKEGLFDKNGKWMDGWESRRKRTPGHDYLIIKLGKPGSISKVDVDTSHFNGNQPSMISIEASNSKSNNIKNFKWKTLVGKKKTKANSQHIFKTSSKSVFTHIKLNIFPDGGVARLRLYGSISKKNNNFGGLYSSDEVRIEPRLAIPAVAKYLQSIGIDFLWNEEVLDFSHQKIITQKRKIQFKKLIMAPGNHLKGLGRDVFEKKEVQSSKLHMLRVMPEKEITLPGGIMADLTLMRYPGYENLPSKKKT